MSLSCDLMVISMVIVVWLKKKSVVVLRWLSGFVCWKYDLDKVMCLGCSEFWLMLVCFFLFVSLCIMIVVFLLVLSWSG